jgi:hypothetical protein
MIKSYETILDDVRQVALDPEASLRLIAAILDGHREEGGEHARAGGSDVAEVQSQHLRR